MKKHISVKDREHIERLIDGLKLLQQEAWQHYMSTFAQYDMPYCVAIGDLEKPYDVLQWHEQYEELCNYLCGLYDEIDERIALFLKSTINQKLHQNSPEIPQ